MPSKRILVCACTLLLALAGTAFGQGSVATLTGTVLDSAGGVVPGASVTVTNNETKVEHKTTTTDAGAFTLPYLPPGNYTINVGAPGFRTSTMENVILRVAQTRSVNVSLEVGAVTESVTVSAAPPLLESGSAEIGRYVTTEEYKSWPILVDDGQRQIQSFIFSSLPGTTGNTFKGSINGGQNYSHEILIEGIPLGRSDLSGGNNNEFSPSAESIGQFKLQTGAIGAQYNGGQTAVANFNIKSGTNELHGSGFYYGQNEYFNALNMDAKVQGLKKSRHREHNYGGSVGGPVYIPKIYDGRNRTFFFFSYEDDHRDELRFSGFDTLPTPAFKRGDFSGLLNPAYTGNANSGKQIGTDALGRPIIFGQIYDPTTTRSVNGQVVRDPFQNNIIPESKWSPVAKNVIQKIGIRNPDIDRLLRNTNRVGTSSPFFDLDLWLVKGDHQITDKHRVSAMYNDSYRQRSNNGSARYLPVPGLATSSWQLQTTPGRLFRGSLDSTISATILNRVAFGYNWFNNINGAPTETIDKDLAGQIGIQNTSPAWFPVFRFDRGLDVQGGPTDGRTYRMGVGFGGPSPNGSYIAQDDVTWIRGKHSFRFGYEYKLYFYDSPGINSSGDFRFSPTQTGLTNYLASTGHSFASFLLGASYRADRSINTIAPKFRQPQHGFYAMDDWKITPNLTANLGLRWEIIPSLYEADDNISFIDLNAPNPDAANRPGALVFGKKPHNTYWRELGPRVGLAYRFSDKVVLRGGYAITNTPPIRNAWGYDGFTYGFNGGVPLRRSTTGFVDDPVFYLHQRYPDYSGGTLPNTDPGSGNFDAYQTTAPDAQRPGYVQNWNFTIQYQLPSEVVVEAAYVGNKGTRVWGGSAFSEMNGLPATMLSLGDTLRETVADRPQYTPYAGFPEEETVAQALRRFPQYYSVQEAFPYNVNSNYNSLQLTVTRHLTTGLGFLAAYTFSKTIGYGDSNGPDAYDTVAQDYYNRSLERSITSFSFPHVFKLTWVWETPFGKGRRWNLGPANWALGGWQLSAVHNYRSGDPIQISQSGIEAPNGFSGSIRPDFTGAKVKLNGAPGTTDYFNGTPYLNPAAFRQSPRTGNGVPLRVGDVPRFLPNVRGPHYMDEQFRMAKKFPIVIGDKERANFGVGLVMTNPFNRTTRSFGCECFTLNIDEADFGQLYTRGGGRTLQIEGRIEF